MVGNNKTDSGQTDHPAVETGLFSRVWAVLSSLSAINQQDLLAEDVQEKLVSTISRIFQVQVSGLMLVQDHNATITLYYAETKQFAHYDRVDLAWEEGIIEKAILTRTSLAISNDPVTSNKGLLGYFAEMPFGYCAPLWTEERALGAILVFNPTPFPTSGEDESMLEWIANQTAENIHHQLTVRVLKAAAGSLRISRDQLLHSRNVLRALFDSFPDGLYIIDHQYQLTAVNMQRARRAGRHPNLLVGGRCYQTLFNQQAPCPECRVLDTLNNGDTSTRTYRDKDMGGEILEWEIYTYPILDSESQVVQAIVLEQDITEKRRLELTLAQSEKLAAMGQWAASLAHEINNPLTAIIANAQLLKREIPPEDDKHELVDLIARAGERANHVVRNMLDLARKEEYMFGPTDINQTIRRSLEFLQHELAARSIHLFLESGEDLPLVNASPDHLQGVWLNLLTNAMDSIDRVSGEISLNTFARENEVYVVVEDNGQGIPPERLAHIFEPFYTTKAPGQGTGLGLPVCQRIIKQHGGRILVESQPGKGTKFTVILPRA